jgi:hypothetical protein
MFMAITRFKKSTYNYADCTGQVKHWRSASEDVIRAASDVEVSWTQFTAPGAGTSNPYYRPAVSLKMQLLQVLSEI